MRQYDSFWTSSRVERLREATQGLMDAFGMNSKDLTDQIRFVIDEPESGGEKERIVGSESFYYRFLKGKTERYGRGKLTGILLGMKRTVALKDPPSTSEIEAAKPLIRLYQEFVKETGFRDSSEVPQRIESLEPAEPVVRPIDSFRRLAAELSKLLKIDSDSGASAEKQLFRFAHEGSREIHFLTYRLSSMPGFVQRSFTAITRPNAASPFPGFGNYYVHRGHKRNSKGICIAFKKQMLFFGTSDGGDASKIMVVDAKELAAWNGGRLTGLLITKEYDGVSSASRVILVPTEVKHSSKANTGRQDFSQVESEHPGLVNELQGGLSLSRDTIYGPNKRVLDEEELEALMKNAIREQGLVFRSADDEELFPASIGLVKVQAAWATRRANLLEPGKDGKPEG